MRGQRTGLWGWGVRLIVGGLLLAIPLGLPAFYVNLIGQVLIFAILALSLDLLAGVLGLWSLGHAAAFGVAAYTVALLVERSGTPWGIQLVSGLAAAAAVGVAGGVVVLRVRGLYFMMLTLGIAQVLWALAENWTGLTGGADGVPGIGRPNPFTTTYSFYGFLAACFALILLILRAVYRSNYGLILRGIRENAVRMEALGVATFRARLGAYVLAATIGGFAGVLFAWQQGLVSPEVLSVDTSAETLLMVILGGAGTLGGPILGATIVVLLQTLVSTLTARWMTALGICYILTVLGAPRGLYPVLIPRYERIYTALRSKLGGMGDGKRARAERDSPSLRRATHPEGH